MKNTSGDNSRQWSSLSTISIIDFCRQRRRIVAALMSAVAKLCASNKCNKYLFLKNNSLENRDFNSKQKNRDSHFIQNRAALLQKVYIGLVIISWISYY